jgi:hypothetical protein
MIKSGRSNMFLRIVKQNEHATGSPDGFRRTQCEYTDWVLFSKACKAKFSQYSTVDWFSKSYGRYKRDRKSGNRRKRVDMHLIDELS